MSVSGDIDNTWVECLTAFKAEVDAMQVWETICLPMVDQEQLLCSPEIFDPKTDTSYEWYKYGTATGYFASSSLPDVSKYSEAQILEVVDALFAKEVLFLRGRNLLQGMYQFVYFLRLHALKEKHPVLYAYSRATLRTVDFVARIVSMTGVRDEEEFPGISGEVDTQGDCPIQEIVEELEAAISITKLEDLKQRLTFRKVMLQLYFEVFNAESKKSIQDLVSVCREALAVLQSYTRTTEPVVDSGLFRSETSVWLTAVVPPAPVDTPAFKETIDAYRASLEHIISLRPLFTGNHSLASVSDVIEAFSAKRPLLFTRCIAIVLMFGENASTSFLYRAPLQQLVLETLANQHGAPLYGKLAEGDANVAMEVAYFCNQRQNATKFGMQVSDEIRRWVNSITRAYLTYWESLLCNRGRAHRRLTNLIEDLRITQMESLNIDSTILQAQRTGLSNSIPEANDRELVSRGLVLTAFAVDLTCHVMTTVLHLMVELRLLSRAEYAPWSIYCSHINSARMENLGVLYLGLQNRPIPERRVTRTGVPAVNPVLTTRFATTPSAAILARYEGNGMHSDMLFRAATLLEAKGTLDLSGPATSLVPVSQTFHNRFRAFAMIQRPQFLTMQFCDIQKLRLLQAAAAETEEGQPRLDLNSVMNVVKQVADRTKAVQALAAKDAPLTVPALADLEKAARATAVSLNFLATMTEEALAAFELTIDSPSGAPGHLALVLKRKAIK